MVDEVTEKVSVAMEFCQRTEGIFMDIENNEAGKGEKKARYINKEPTILRESGFMVWVSSGEK